MTKQLQFNTDVTLLVLIKNAEGSVLLENQHHHTGGHGYSLLRGDYTDPHQSLLKTARKMAFDAVGDVRINAIHIAGIKHFVRADDSHHLTVVVTINTANKDVHIRNNRVGEFRWVSPKEFRHLPMAADFWDSYNLALGNVATNEVFLIKN